MERIKRASLFLLSVAIVASAISPQAVADPAADAARWLVSRQRPSGELPSYSGSGVGELVVALLAGGETGEPVDRGLSYLRRRGTELAASPAHAARIVMALVGAGEDPRSPTDFVSRIHEGYDETTGAWEDNVYADALAALGLLAAGDNLPGRAVTYLRAQQCPTGGFSWRAACLGAADTDTTSMVVNVLLASGLAPSDTTISRARDFLHGVQNDDGGFGLEDGKPTNANSTGLALSAIAALGEDPARGVWRTPTGRDPVAALLALRHPSGGFKYQASDDDPGDYATVQALPGLRGFAYPVPRVDRTPAAAGEGAGGRIEAVGTSVARASERTPSTAPPHASRAGVIVSDGERTRSFCIAFDEAEIPGDDLLSRTRLALEVSRTAIGSAVCSVEGTGCGTGDCFCRYPTFWGYWTLEPGDEEWTFSERGASDRVARDGSVDAWVWGRDGKPAPPVTTVAEVCASAEGGTSSPASASPPRTHMTPDDDADASSVVLPFASALAALLAIGALVVARRRSR